MSSRLKLPLIRLKAGGVITFQGTAAGQAVYWSLVGHDAGHGEVAALGSLSKAISQTDASGCAVNLYMAPETVPPDYHDHLTVKAVI
jgi:hypothetical protein